MTPVHSFYVDGHQNVRFKLLVKIDFFTVCNVCASQTFITCLRGFANKNFPKHPRLLWKWVGGSRSHSEFCFVENRPINSPKPVLIFWSSIP